MAKTILAARQVIGAVTIRSIIVTAPYGLFHQVTILDEAILPSGTVIIHQGNYSDEDENNYIDYLTVQAKAGSGSLQLKIESTNGYSFGGILKFNYIIS